MSDVAANRASLLTPPGPAAIAVVRLTGPLVWRFIAEHLSKPPVTGRCVHTELRDADRIIDDPVVVQISPHTIDVNLHGGEWVVHECLELAIRSGFEVCPSLEDWPEASSVLEREMLTALPHARTEQTVTHLLAQPELWHALGTMSRQALQTQLRRMLDDRALWRMLNPPRIAIVGVPNAGKSTLANQLFGQQRSITADVAGTTRDWVGDWANLDGLAVYLLDTPGLRHSDDQIEQAAIRLSREQVAAADLVIGLLDPTQPPEPQWVIMSQFPDALLVTNKADLPSTWPTPGRNALPTVASTGQGVDALRRAIRDRFSCDPNQPPVARWWTPAQQARILRAIASEDPANVVVGHE